jgi:hypothetical protein
MAFAMLVTILGFLMLFDRMGILSSAVWSYFWPMLVIGIGLSMMFNKMANNHYFDECCLKGEHHHGKKKK